MGARQYNPEIGRWLSPDTIVPDPANPQSFNRFSYAYNNPVNYTDPSGHMATSDDGGGCGPKACPPPLPSLDLPPSPSLPNHQTYDSDGLYIEVQRLTRIYARGEAGIHGGGKLGIFEIDKEGRLVLESYLDGPGSKSFWEDNTALGPAFGVPGTGISLVFENASGPNGTSNDISLSGEAFGANVTLQAGGGQFALGGGGAIPLFGASLHAYIVVATGETKRYIVSRGHLNKMGGITGLIEQHGPQGGTASEPIPRFSERSPTCSSGYAMMVKQYQSDIWWGLVEVLP